MNVLYNTHARHLHVIDFNMNAVVSLFRANVVGKLVKNYDSRSSALVYQYSQFFSYISSKQRDALGIS